MTVNLISIHAPLAGCDIPRGRVIATPTEFQSTHPLRGATRFCPRRCRGPLISIHAPLAGCDDGTSDLTIANGQFQSTHPLRGATSPWAHDRPRNKNFNPRTPCGVRHFRIKKAPSRLRISIHAPLAGCDWAAALCARRNPISIHAPLAGCDYGACDRAVRDDGFQSTHPLRGATATYLDATLDREISIHAPLAGCDGIPYGAPLFARHFNPRTPCGVRRIDSRTLRTHYIFQSTHPLRGATASCSSARRGIKFQSTHPLRGATRRLYTGLYVFRNFNPRTPCGVRQHRRPRDRRNSLFQSTHPLRGATAKTYKENCTFFELADKLSARIAAKKPSAKADRCA